MAVLKLIQQRYSLEKPSKVWAKLGKTTSADGCWCWRAGGAERRLIGGDQSRNRPIASHASWLDPIARGLITTSRDRVGSKNKTIQIKANPRQLMDEPNKKRRESASSKRFVRPTSARIGLDRRRRRLIGLWFDAIGERPFRDGVHHLGISFGRPTTAERLTEEPKSETKENLQKSETRYVPVRPTTIVVAPPHMSCAFVGFAKKQPRYWFRFLFTEDSVEKKHGCQRNHVWNGALWTSLMTAVLSLFVYRFYCRCGRSRLLFSCTCCLRFIKKNPRYWFRSLLTEDSVWKKKHDRRRNLVWNGALWTSLTTAVLYLFVYRFYCRRGRSRLLFSCTCSLRFISRRSLAHTNSESRGPTGFFPFFFWLRWLCPPGHFLFSWTLTLTFSRSLARFF